jgi:Zn-dependent peptidase ImmA (M78 family)
MMRSKTWLLKSRKQLGLRSGPIANMVWLMEHAGAIVVRTELSTDKLDSFSQWLDCCPYVVVSAEKGTAVRYNFDLAHELGHLLLHAHLDRQRVSNPREHKALEDQANRFAGAFLLPAEGFVRDVFAPTLGAFRSLKPKWHTSIGVMINRVSDLGIVTQQEQRWLGVQYGKKGWRRWEPLDDDIAVQTPQLLSQAMRLLLDKGIQTRADILTQVPLAAEDIEGTTGLPTGFLTEGDVVPVRLKVHPDVSESADQLVPFPKRAPWTS